MNIAVLLHAIHDAELTHGVTRSSHRLEDASIAATVLALSARRAETGSIVTGIAAGPGEWDAAIRQALSLGLESVVRVWSGETLEGDVPGQAAALAAALPPACDLVIAGANTGGDESELLPFALAEQLAWPAIEGVASIGTEDGRTVMQVRANGGKRRTYLLRRQSVLLAASSGVAPYPTVARQVAARRAVVPLVPVPPACAPRVTLQGYGPARPVTRHLLQPSSSGNAASRLRQLMSGGTSKASSSRTIAGSGLASQLAELLKKEGFVQ